MFECYQHGHHPHLSVCGRVIEPAGWVVAVQ